MTAPAWVRVAGSPTSFRFQGLPAGPLDAGARFACSVVATPAGPGELTENVALEFYDATTSAVVAYVAHATVEDMRVFVRPATLDYGTVAFGSTVDKSFEVRNDSALPIPFVGAGLPSVDWSVVTPTLPFTLAPGETRLVTLRCAPRLSWTPVDTAAQIRPEGADGSAAITVRATPGPGTEVVDFGIVDMVDDVTPVLTVEAVPHVWAIQIEAWRPGELMHEPSGAAPNPLSVALFEDPKGGHHESGWFESWTCAACLPCSHLPGDQVPPGGGTWRFQFRLRGGPTVVPLRVRALLKGSVTGAPAMTGTLDLNLWIDNALGITATTAPTDPALQAALVRCDQLLGQVGVRVGGVDYYDCDSTLAPVWWEALRQAFPTGPGAVKDRLNITMTTRPGGSPMRICGCAVAHSSESFPVVGQLPDVGKIIAHEACHYLGLWHTWEHPTDVLDPNANIMGSVTGTGLSPGQGAVIRAHPLVR